MGYFEALGLNKEPFSTSPDPAFFYRSAAHTSALQRLEIALRLKRGLSLILGDVGTGKTTLGRVLTQFFQDEEEFEFNLILNPLFQSEFQFLEHLCKICHIHVPMRSAMDCMDALQNHLYQKGVVEGKTIVLLVDEGQNLSANLIEVLRTLLNFETNEHKLLQLVIMSQLEALPRFQRTRNFMDRVNLKYIINPLDLEDTKKMIQFRVTQAGMNKGNHVFTDAAIRLIYEKSQGYPRRITFLCRSALEKLIMQSENIVDAAMIEHMEVEKDRLSPVTR